MLDELFWSLWIDRNYSLKSTIIHEFVTLNEIESFLQFHLR